MAYDNNDAYPENAKVPFKESAQGSATVTSDADEDSLEKRVLDLIAEVKSDMDDLQRDRAVYQKYYMAEREDGDASDSPRKRRRSKTGRSEIVSSDVQDTIEAMMPDLMRVFMGGRDVLSLTGREPEDDFGAQLMEEKVNFDIQKENKGFQLIYTYIKDALMGKMGVVKYWWEKRDVTEPLTLKGLTVGELQSMLQQADIIISKIKVIDNTGKERKDLKFEEIVSAGYGDYFTYDATGKTITERISRPHFENVPPEEFGFDIRAKHIKEAFCYHRKSIHKNKLRKYGVTSDEIREMKDRFDGATSGGEQIIRERYQDLGAGTFVKPKNKKNFVFIYECYIDDYDKDGNPVNKKVLMFGDKLLKEEVNSYEVPPFCAMSPILIPHRLCGRSVAELALEIQDLKTALIRYILDNVYFQNNGMRVVNPYRIDVKALMTQNRPGGIVPTLHDINPHDAIYDVPIQQLPSHIMKVLEYVDGPYSQNRLGITDYNQGLDSKSLNKTATGISIITSAAQRRIELIARIFAETGMKDLFEAAVKMNVDYFDQAKNIKINKKWQLIQPEQIDGKYDITVEIGSFTSSSEMSFQQMQMMMNQYLQVGGAVAKLGGPQALQQLYSIENLKNIFKKEWEHLGFRNTDQFLTPDQPKGGGNGRGIPGQPGGNAGGYPQAGGAGQGIAGQPAPQGVRGEAEGTGAGYDLFGSGGGLG